MDIDKILYNKDYFHDDDQEIMKMIIDLPGQSVSVSDLKKYTKKELESRGWIYPFRYHPKLTNTITAVRDKTGLCLPLGNIARLFYDLLKLQYCFSKNIIERGIIICPIAPEGNRAYIERLDREMQIYLSVIDIPLCAIGTNIRG